MDTQKLDQLTDEQRRILCAEALGWMECYLSKAFASGIPPNSNKYSALPDPDHNADDALRLVERLKLDCHVDVSFVHDVVVSLWGFRESTAQSIEVRESSFPRAIVSAFLLATGKAI